MEIFITRMIPQIGMDLLKKAGLGVDVSPHDRPLNREELLSALKAKSYDGVLSFLTDKIDAEIFEAAPTVKIFANFAVGFNNFDVAEAKKRGIVLTNTPSNAVNESVAEHTFAMILALACRIVEGDNYMKAGKYGGWDPNLLIGDDLKGKVLGVLGVGRIGRFVVHKAVRGFGMDVVYYDVIRNEHIEKEYGAKFVATPEDAIRAADILTIHVPLLDSTHHLMNAKRLALMKKTAYLVNTSRGPVVDEAALVAALKNGVIRGAALDVYENEPKLADGLSDLPNVILTPHIASATAAARDEMAAIATTNLVEYLSGRPAPNPVK